jgi:hypothetical protein
VLAPGELIEFLPAKAAAMKRHEPKGETTKVGSWQYSQAEVREHQDRRLFGIRGVEPEGLERSRRSAGRRLYREASARGMGEGAARKVVEAMDVSGLAKKGT